MAETKIIQQESNKILGWIIRLLKGVLIGIGFITPGLSGGVLAVVFGLYEPLMRFLGNLRNKFLQNLRFFLPVGIGLAIGVVFFSAVVDYAFTHFAAQFTWLFIGFISGTFPSLIKTAGEQGRTKWHWVMLAVVAAGMFFFLRWLETVNNVTVAPSFGAWLMSGALIGLGVIVPGMSPSNFLIYMGLYQQMAAGIKDLDFGVIIPLGLGGLVCVLALSRLAAGLFKKFHAGMYHIIIGIVVGSTLAIIPGGVSGWTIAVCALLFVLGAAASYALAKLDERYPHESLF